MSLYLKITILIIVGAAIGAVFYINNTSSDNTPASGAATPPAEKEPQDSQEAVTSRQEAPALQTADISEPEEVAPVDFSNPVVQLQNTNGETINAELLALEGNSLTVRRDDGQTFTFDSGMLVDADQHYVAKHFEGRPQPKLQDGQPTTKEYIIPDSSEYLQSLYQELLDGAN